ncbi:MAG TPA: TonB-dependent receptor [Pyrinomonadaceae bacterium]|nr:TonB-dependent receptor [Pyrinomonadaceae bacterium]
MNSRQISFGRRAVALLGALVLPLLVCAAANAQGTSSVRGTVSDAQGNLVAGATVTLTNTETNAARTVTTSGEGGYAFELIKPGTYRLEAEAAGFKKGVITDVRALVAKPTEINVALEVGAVTESVTVAAGTGEVLLNTQDATLGNNFVAQQIAQLPLEARNVATLLTLQPGTTRSGYVAGARADQANITLDGVDINEQQTNQIGTNTAQGGATSSNTDPSTNTVLRLNSEAVEEFRVVTTNANAQMGRTSGAQISVVTKSGGNEFSGSAFWFHRPTILTANDFFNNRAGVERPSLIRNTYGASVGGPIKRDKLFFFYSYEARKDRSQRSVVRRVPLPSLGRGELRFVNPSGGITTLTAAQIATATNGLGVSPAALSALAAAAARYPANEFGTEGDSPNASTLLNTAGYRFNVPLPVDLNSHVARFDYSLTDRQTVFVRANAIHDVIGGVPAFPDTPSPDTWSHPSGIAVGHTWTISSRFVNNFHYGLTRQAFTEQGDASKNEVYFRFVFFPVLDSRTLSRVTPTHNFTNDFSWIAGDHSAQFGTNIRIIRNRRTSFTNAFDTAYTNPSAYAGSGSILSDAINGVSPIGSGQASVVQNALAALLGRLSTYTARFTFDREGALLAPGAPTEREFATEEYDFYAQDTWKLRRNLTLTYGLRYGLSMPIYETQGYETKPNIPLSEYFRRRIAASERGQNYIEPLVVDLSGPANNRDTMYPLDKNNFQPRVGVAWSPHFNSGFLGALFGGEENSVIRGGFAMTNDYIGQQLATRFDSVNSLGFSSSQTSPFNFCNFTTRICPAFTSFTQDVRGLPRITPPTSLTFPQQQPPDNSLRIETSLDSEIISPTSYSWNLTWERKLPKGLVVQMSYIGRDAKDLLASRDVMMPNNLRDPQSGMDWYTAAGALEDIRRNLAAQGITASSPRAAQIAAISAIGPIPYFENLFGNIPGLNTTLCGSRGATLTTATQAVLCDALVFNRNDWVTTQAELDLALLDAGRGQLFYQPQYGALSSFSTIANSIYHAGTLSVRERFGEKLYLDFNYTFSKSMDDASGLQTSGGYGSAFITNPLRQRDNYSVSDFDVRHIINVNGVYQLPFGRGQAFLSDANGLVQNVLGGWQLTGIMRWNSGLPISVPFDAATWATNWNVQSWGVRTRPLEACVATPPNGGAPALFGCNLAEAYQSLRSAKPGETGDRNALRLPGYFVVDMGLGKSFVMPWSEGHKLQLRFEAFNVTNTQRMGNLVGGRTGYGIVVDPFTATPPPNWSAFGTIQGERRVMQFGFRYQF